MELMEKTLESTKIFEGKIITILLDKPTRVTLLTLNGDSKDAYNDVGHEGVAVTETDLGLCDGAVEITLEAHSVNVIRLG